MRSARLLSILLMTLLTGHYLRAQEMEVLNDTIEWTMESTHGYYFFQPPSGSPSNWKTPYDYFNGEFYTRYEIISEATDEPCGLQVGIWQYRLESNIQDGEKTYSEIMASIVQLNDGPGTVVTNHSSPGTWWKSYEGVDFNRVYDFWHLGINIWSLDPRSVIANNNWGGDNALWAIRDKWFPIKVYVTVVAVASGHSFSGWDNYIHSAPPKPGYTINYSDETTAQTVPSSDEYSTSPDMSSAISGTGAVVDLTPGQDLYFRTKAAGGDPASPIQTLVIPDRPSAPAFTYDPDNQRTSEVVTSEHEIASAASMSGATSGTGDYVSFAPGETRYFRKKATSGAFRSEIQELTGYSLAPPAYAIDFINERTTTNVPSTDEYSHDNFATTGTAGTGEYLTLTPGGTVYFRRRAEGSIPASGIQTLQVPDRPSTPDMSINYDLEETMENVHASVHHSDNAEMTGSEAGTGEPVALTPGEDRWFRIPATVTNFVSGIQHLEVPDRPDTPLFEIDFLNETTTTPVPDSIEYSSSPTFSASAPGENDPLALTPGTYLYFRTSHSVSSFRSDVHTLEVPSRPILASDDASDTITVSPITLHAIFGTSVTGFDLSDPEVTNATLSNLREEYIFDLVPDGTETMVSVTIPANVVEEGNFTSETFSAYFKGTAQAVRADAPSDMMVYPNPFTDRVSIVTDWSRSGTLSISVTDMNGRTVYSKAFPAAPTILIDLGSLDAGAYLMVVEMEGNRLTRMIQKQERQ